jgi:uncharacterized protein
MAEQQEENESASVVETVEFRGHPCVSSLHPTTIELTTEDWLTEKGDCIVGVSATKGCAGLSEEMKSAIRRDGSRILMTIRVGDLDFRLSAFGDRRLELSSEMDMVIRKSGFVSGRTLALGASAAARDLPREMVQRLRAPETTGTLRLEVFR